MLTDKQYQELISLEYQLTQYGGFQIDELRLMYLRKLKDFNQPLIISGFPGIGKSFLFNKKYPTDGSPVIQDSDSSKFDKNDFPKNYIKQIIQDFSSSTVVLVSSHELVREMLTNVGIPYLLVYPNSTLKYEYISRYYARGSTNDFIKFIDNNWDNWMISLSNQHGCIHIRLQSGQYLSDVFETLKHNE